MAEEKIFATIEEALQDFRKGKFVIVLDDEDRENEGDLIIAAEKITAEQIQFMRMNGTGIICAPLTAGRASSLSLPIQVTDSSDPNKTAYTVGTDAKGTSTGVSGRDMALTMTSLADDDKLASDFRKPGHVFPLIARPHGVAERRGHTEASVDLCRLAGLKPTAVIVELVNNIHNCPEGEDASSDKYRNGEMMRLPDCAIFAKKHNIKLITIEQLLEYRYRTEPHLKSDVESGKLAQGVELDGQCDLPVDLHNDPLGKFELKCVYSHHDRRHHTVLVMGDITGEEPVLTRVHSECFTGDVLGSQRCDCRWQLHQSMQLIAERGRGILIYYVGHEGRGIGYANKIKAYYKQQQEGMDTYAANQALGFKDDHRTYETAKDILKLLGVHKIELMTSNGEKAAHFDGLVAGVMTLVGPTNQHNAKYIEAKMARTTYISRSSSSPNIPGDSTLSVTNGKESIKSAPHTIPVLDHPQTQTLRVGVVRTIWNETLVKPFSERITQLLLKQGILPNNIVELEVDGAVEVPFAAKALTKKVDVVICLGLILKGESSHYDDVRAAVFPAMVNIGLETGVPIINGVYACLNEDQAVERYGPVSGKDVTLVAAALRMATLKL